MKSPHTADELRSHAPDLCVVAAYGRILPPALLEIPELGCINVHASLLPRHRGASPIAHAIIEGDAETGVSIMRLEEGLDSGPVYATRARPLLGDESTGSLTVEVARLCAAGAAESKRID